MDFDNYWVEGKFTLHSGDTSNRLWDAKLLRNKENSRDLAEVVHFLRDYIDPELTIVGIKTMGAEIGMLVGNCFPFDPKEDALEQPLPKHSEYIIFDDVLTRGSSVLQVIEHIGKLPKYILVLVIRNDITGGATEIEGIPIYELRSLMK